MNELIDQGFIYLIEGLRNEQAELFGEFISDAQALSALFMLLYFGVESYKMMAGDKKLEITPLLRPFALGIVLMLWGPFLKIVDFPAQVITKHSKAMFNDQLTDIELLSKRRYALIDSVAMELIKTSSEVERAENEVRKSGWTVLGIDLSAIGETISGMYLYVVGKIKQLMFSIIEFIVVTFWQVCVYLIFFLQLMFSSILAILGPLSFAFSILPSFRDTYINWLSRYISVSLYGAIAYIILSLSLTIMKFSLDKEVSILESALKNETVFIAYAALSSGGTNMFIITCIIGAISLLTVPVISTWIISTTGAGSAIGTMVGGAAAATKIIGK